MVKLINLPMFLRKKKPKRLYYPAKSKWYARPRRRPAVKRTSRRFKKGVRGFLKDLVKKSLYLVITGVIFGLLLTFLFFSSYFSVTNTEVIRENFNVDSAAIENKLNEFIGKNILFTPKSKIHKTIRTYFPEFAIIEVHKIFPSTLKIYLESHPIVANLRVYYVLPEPEKIVEEDFTELNKAIEELSGSDPNLTTLESLSPLTDEEIADPIFDIEEGDGPEPVEQRSLLNCIGQAIFDQEEDLELVAIIIRGLTQPIENREQVIPPEHMDYILETIQHFINMMGFDVLEVEYLSNAREIHLKTTNNLVIWISIERDFKDQINKLHTIYEPAELSKEDLSYIDLRVREKVIYCPQGSHCDQ